MKEKLTHDVALKEAASWLRKIERLKADTVFNLGLAANTLEKAIGKSDKKQSGEGLPVEGDGVDFLQTQVFVENYGRKGTVGFIELSLFKGPL